MDIKFTNNITVISTSEILILKRYLSEDSCHLRQYKAILGESPPKKGTVT